MLKWLLEQDFMPHGHCYYWRPDILWTYVVSDSVIALAYYSIPVTLVYFASKRKDFPFRGVLALFAAFIILCGTTHILDIITIWNPIYAVDAIIKAATALVSIATALVMIPLVPIALSMRSPAELETANNLLLVEIQRRGEAEKQLETAVEDLRRSNDELEQFASAASHDLQAPLRAVVNFTQLLKRDLDGKLSKDTEEYLGLIEDGGSRMQMLIKDLLQVAHVSQERGDAAAVDMNRALETACGQLQFIIKESGAIIRAAKLPPVLGHEVLIAQLLQNLVGNALKYVDATVKPDIEITATREQDHWHFVVADNGIGIAENQLKAIFVIFRRLHTQDRFSGSGIGLSLCKKIVDWHKGRIWAESMPGKGSQFHFTLPAA